jgi:hypothetical protein
MAAGGRLNDSSRMEAMAIGEPREARFVRLKREHEWRSKVKTSEWS